MELQLKMDELQPVVLLAQDWPIGKCLGKVTEEYSEFILANRNHVRAINKLYDNDDRKLANADIDNARHAMILEAIDTMTAIRTLLWKMGVDDDKFKKYVTEVNVKNSDRGYF